MIKILYNKNIFLFLLKVISSSRQFVSLSILKIFIGLILVYTNFIKQLCFIFLLYVSTIPKNSIDIGKNSPETFGISINDWKLFLKKD